MTDYSTTLAGIRGQVISDGAVGRSVYRGSATDDLRPPCVVITDSPDSVSPAISGDGTHYEQSRPMTVEIIQSNGRDADLLLASRVARAVHGARFTVNGTPTRVFASGLSSEPEEGYYIQSFTATAYQAMFTP